MTNDELETCLNELVRQVSGVLDITQQLRVRLEEQEKMNRMLYSYLEAQNEQINNIRRIALEHFV